MGFNLKPSLLSGIKYSALGIKIRQKQISMFSDLVQFCLISSLCSRVSTYFQTKAPIVEKKRLLFVFPYLQGRSEGTSGVAFDVLMINCKIDFINLFIFNCLISNINLFNCNCLTSNFCFPQNASFTNRRKRLFMDARPYFGILNSFRKMMTCYLRGTNKFWRYRALRTSILKCGFATKGIELTRFVLFEVLEIPQLRSASVQKICGIQVKLWSKKFQCAWLRW